MVKAPHNGHKGIDVDTVHRTMHDEHESDKEWLCPECNEEPKIIEVPKSLNGYKIVGIWHKSDTRAIIIAFDSTRSDGYRWVVAIVSGQSLKYGEWFMSRYSHDLDNAHQTYTERTHPDYQV